MGEESSTSVNLVRSLLEKGEIPLVVVSDPDSTEEALTIISSKDHSALAAISRSYRRSTGESGSLW